MPTRAKRRANADLRLQIADLKGLPMSTETINPNSAMMVVKHDGREVGRIAASAPNASAYINELSSQYKSGVTVDIEEDALSAELSRMFNTPRF
jgi:hypothetical protein